MMVRREAATSIYSPPSTLKWGGITKQIGSSSDLWEPTPKSCRSNDLWVSRPNSNPPKEIPVRTFNNLAFFEAPDYAF